MVVPEPSALETTPVDLPPEIVAILAAFAPLFSDRVWVKAQTLAVGALLATGRRTVRAVLRVMGLSQERHFTNDHRVLNRDAWSCLAAGKVLLGLIVRPSCVRPSSTRIHGKDTASPGPAEVTWGRATAKMPTAASIARSAKSSGAN